MYSALRRGIRKKYHKYLSPYRDICVVSFPKSGRTWLRIMLDRMNIVLQYDHHDTFHSSKKHYKELPADALKFAANRVILMVRDPRDTAVSGYFQAVKRLNVFEGNVAQFIRDERHGIKKILKFHEMWYHNQSTPRDFMVIRYEDMHRDTFAQMRSVLDFANVHVSDEKLREVIEFGSFNNMHKLEKTGYFNNTYKGGVLRPGNINDPESFKTRKGEAGGFREYLNENDRAYCAQLMQEMQNPFYNDFKP